MKMYYCQKYSKFWIKCCQGPICVKLLQKNMTRPFFNRNLNWLHTPQDFHGMIYILGTPWFWGLATSQVLISNFCIPWCRMGHVPYNPMNIKVRKIALKCHAYLLKVVYCRYFWKYMPMDDIELLVSFKWGALSVRCVLPVPCNTLHRNATNLTILVSVSHLKWINDQ